MTRFVLSECGVYVNLADIVTAKSVGAGGCLLTVTTRDGDEYDVERFNWKQADAAAYIPASPGIRVIDAPASNKAPVVGASVIAWQVGGPDAYPLGVTLNATAEIHDDSEDVAYLFPDGHVENCDGCWPTMEGFTTHFQRRRERWLAQRAVVRAAL